MKKSLQEGGQKRGMLIKIEFTPLLDCNILPFLNGFNKKTLENSETLDKIEIKVLSSTI